MHSACQESLAVPICLTMSGEIKYDWILCEEHSIQTKSIVLFAAGSMKVEDDTVVKTHLEDEKHKYEYVFELFESHKPKTKISVLGN